MARIIKAACERERFSKSLASRRQRPSHANVLSTIQRFGKVEVVAEVPPLVGGGNPSRAAVLTAAQGFDPRGVLGRLLAGGHRA